MAFRPGVTGQVSYASFCLARYEFRACRIILGFVIALLVYEVVPSKAEHCIFREWHEKSEVCSVISKEDFVNGDAASLRNGRTSTLGFCGIPVF